MTDRSKLAVLLALTSLVAACGPGDSRPDASPSPAPAPGPSASPAPAPSPAPGPAPAPTPNATGRFVDSDVVGLNYNCGGVTGVTDNLAQFQYISGQSCSFSIGGIDLGSAVGAPLMTPVDLVPGASPGVANAAVTDIARLLLSLDDDGDPGNGITISAAVRTTLGGMSLGSAFGSGGFAAAAQMIVSAAFPGRLLVDATTAANHLDLSLVGLFSGPYHCTYSALVGGVNTALGGVVISIATGVITGAGTPTGGGSTFTVAGTVSANGAATMSAGTTSTGATFQGTFLSDGTAAHTSASGTWNDPALGSGTWTCQHD